MEDRVLRNDDEWEGKQMVIRGEEKLRKADPRRI